MVWGFCVYFVYMIPLETDVLRKHRFQLLKSKLPITAIFERLRIEKKVRQIFSVFSTCSFLILKCEIDPGCKQMLFLEHAQSDEWDSLLVKNY